MQFIAESESVQVLGRQLYNQLQTLIGVSLNSNSLQEMYSEYCENIMNMRGGYVKDNHHCIRIAKSQCSVPQLCLSLCNPMDCSPPAQDIIINKLGMTFLTWEDVKPVIKQPVQLDPIFVEVFVYMHMGTVWKEMKQGINSGYLWVVGL